MWMRHTYPVIKQALYKSSDLIRYYIAKHELK